MSVHSKQPIPVSSGHFRTQQNLVLSLQAAEQHSISLLHKPSNLEGFERLHELSELKEHIEDITAKRVEEQSILLRMHVNREEDTPE